MDTHMHLSDTTFGSRGMETDYRYVPDREGREEYFEFKVKEMRTEEKEYGEFTFSVGAITFFVSPEQVAELHDVTGHMMAERAELLTNKVSGGGEITELSTTEEVR